MPDPRFIQNEILNRLKEIYSNGKISSEAIHLPDSIDELFNFCRKNRLDYFLAIKLENSRKLSGITHKKIRKLLQEYFEYENILKSAIQLLHNSLKERPWLLIKTLSSYPHTTSDIDVLVQDEPTSEWLKGLLRKNWHHDMDIDVDHKISWTDSDEVGSDFIWKNTSRTSIKGIQVPIPNALLDSIIRIAHIPFELAEIRLGELLHILNQTTPDDWEVIRHEAERNNWIKTFDKIMNIIFSFHNALDPLVNNNPKKPGHIPITFPFQVPYSLLAYGVWDKKAWKKIWGARYILRDRLFS